MGVADHHLAQDVAVVLHALQQDVHFRVDGRHGRVEQLQERRVHASHGIDGQQLAYARHTFGPSLRHDGAKTLLQR